MNPELLGFLEVQADLVDLEPLVDLVDREELQPKNLLAGVTPWTPGP